MNGRRDEDAALEAPRQRRLARPSLTHYVANRYDLESRTADIFRWIADGKLDVRIDRTFPFREAPKSHERLSSRKAIGKIMLVP